MKARAMADLEPQFREIREQASRLFGSASAEALARRPRPDHWSAAECLAHLNLSADAFFPVWDRELTEARRAQRADGPFRLDFWGWALIWMLEPPPKFRFPAPAKLRPIETGPPESVLQEFLDRQRRILEALRSARGIAIDKIKIGSPVDSRVRYSLWSSFCLTAAHERRHLWQAERALADKF
jgi:hypothetical protein